MDMAIVLSAAVNKNIQQTAREWMREFGRKRREVGKGGRRRRRRWGREGDP